MKKYLPAIIVLSFVALVGTKFTMVNEYCLLSIAQGHGFFGAIRCLKLCDNLYCNLSQGYENFATAIMRMRFLLDAE